MARKPMSPVARITFLLGAGLISAALIIGYVSYRYSFRMMEQSYQNFYLNKAQMIVRSAEPASHGNDAQLLTALDRSWEAAQNRPMDEYICVVDHAGDLLLHSAHPQTVGNYAGDNPVVGESSSAPGRLCELVDLQSTYVGQYVSSSGQDQIAAFVPVPGRKWMLGVHRSRQALREEIAAGFRPLVAGFLAVCGLLMPISLFLIYLVYSQAQRRQLESQAALEESEKRYQSLVDSMPQRLYRTDAGGRIIFANRALVESWSMDLTQCLGKSFGDFLVPELGGLYDAGDLEVVKTGQATDQVVQYRSAAESAVRYIQLVRTPVTDAAGRVIGVQGLFWDVTDRREAEQKLAHTMAQLGAVIQSVPSGIIAVGENSRLTMVNQKAGELLGVDPEEAAGRPVAEVIPNTELLRVMEVGRVELGKPWEFRGRKLMVSRSPIFEGERVVGGVSVFHDESELESVQRKLEETQQLNSELDLLIENLHDGVLITDAAKVSRVNPAFGRISGIPFSSLEGKGVEELDVRRHPFLDAVREVHHQVIRAGSSVTVRRELEGGNEVFITGSQVLGSDGNVARVVLSVRDLTELKSLEEKIKRLSRLAPAEACAGEGDGVYAGIVAESPETRKLLDLCARVAQVDSTVLLKGESGAGKDVLARLIHRLGPRREKPFVSINCGAIPENLLESELFGYERGAFSGAGRDGKPGLFEEADGGVVFLDEVGELPLNLQVKLLTVLQEQRFRRLGSVKNQELNIRIIAATNRDLEEMVAQGGFREDLFYRLFVVPIEVPALRQRREDIMPLALEFLKVFNKKYGVTRTLGPEVLREMENHTWPGNIRELQNVVERMVVTAEGDVLLPRHLPSSIYGQAPADQAAGRGEPGVGVSLREAREELERRLISQALAKSANTREAAKMLGVTHPTVVRKAQKYGLSTSDGSPEASKLH